MMPDWRKSSRSNFKGGDCVEVATLSTRDAQQFAGK